MISDSATDHWSENSSAAQPFTSLVELQLGTVSTKRKHVCVDRYKIIIHIYIALYFRSTQSALIGRVFMNSSKIWFTMVILWYTFKNVLIINRDVSWKLMESVKFTLFLI